MKAVEKLNGTLQHNVNKYCWRKAFAPAHTISNAATMITQLLKSANRAAKAFHNNNNNQQRHKNILRVFFVCFEFCLFWEQLLCCAVAVAVSMFAES